jgi:hypothetical protein
LAIKFDLYIITFNKNSIGFLNFEVIYLAAYSDDEKLVAMTNLMVVVLVAVIGTCWVDSLVDLLVEMTVVAMEIQMVDKMVSLTVSAKKVVALVDSKAPNLVCQMVDYIVH